MEQKLTPERFILYFLELCPDYTNARNWSGAFERSMWEHNGIDVTVANICPNYSYGGTNRLGNRYQADLRISAKVSGHTVIARRKWNFQHRQHYYQWVIEPDERATIQLRLAM